MSCCKKQRSNLYNLAKIAKERLKKNNYTSEFKLPSIDNALCLKNFICSQRTAEELCTRAQDRPPRKTYDEELYLKVCELIESDNLQNPISALIDKQLFSSLDVEAKQYYINNLTQKFKFLKNKYYKEHSNTLIM
jgi:hypothetical protein